MIEQGLEETQSGRNDPYPLSDNVVIMNESYISMMSNTVLIGALAGLNQAIQVTREALGSTIPSFYTKSKQSKVRPLVKLPNTERNDNKNDRTNSETPRELH